MLLVGTLDGWLTAVAPGDAGKVLWSVRPGDIPLVSQSLSALEVSDF